MKYPSLALLMSFLLMANAGANMTQQVSEPKKCNRVLRYSSETDQIRPEVVRVLSNNVWARFQIISYKLPWSGFLTARIDHVERFTWHEHTANYKDITVGLRNLAAGFHQIDFIMTTATHPVSFSACLNVPGDYRVNDIW